MVWMAGDAVRAKRNYCLGAQLNQQIGDGVDGCCFVDLGNLPIHIAQQVHLGDSQRARGGVQFCLANAGGFCRRQSSMPASPSVAQISTTRAPPAAYFASVPPIPKLSSSGMGQNYDDSW